MCLHMPKSLIIQATRCSMVTSVDVPAEKRRSWTRKSAPNNPELQFDIPNCERGVHTVAVKGFMTPSWIGYVAP